MAKGEVEAEEEVEVEGGGGRRPFEADVVLCGKRGFQVRESGSHQLCRDWDFDLPSSIDVRPMVEMGKNAYAQMGGFFGTIKCSGIV